MHCTTIKGFLKIRERFLSVSNYNIKGFFDNIKRFVMCTRVINIALSCNPILSYDYNYISLFTNAPDHISNKLIRFACNLYMAWSLVINKM